MNILQIKDRALKEKLRKARDRKAIRGAESHRNLAKDYTYRANLINALENPTPAQESLSKYALAMVIHHKQEANRLINGANNA